MNLLSRFEIFSCSLGSESVDGIDEICLKYGTPVTLCVFLAYIEVTVAREGHYICLGYKEDVNMLLLLFETNAHVSSLHYKLITEKYAVAKSKQRWGWGQSFLWVSDFSSEHFHHHFSICLSTLFHYKISFFKDKSFELLQICAIQKVGE